MSVLSRAIAYWRSGGSISYDGFRDYNKVFGWQPNPQHEHFTAIYRSHEVAGRIVDAPAKALWSDPPIIDGDDAFDSAWTDLLGRIPVFQTFLRLDKLAGLGRFAALVVGYDDGSDMSLPINPRKQKKVLYLQPYAEGSISVKGFDTDLKSPRYGKPLMYEVSPKNIDPNIGIPGTSKIGQAFNVHYSRVLHVADNALESLVYGHSRLEGVYNTLCDMMKVTGGSAETFWLIGNRGLHVDIDKELELDTDDEAALSDELREYEHEMRRVIRTRGVKINPLGSDTPNPKPVFEVQIALLAIRTGIPQRILMGAEAGQLASQQDRAEWAARIAERITEFGGPIMLYPFLRMLIDATVLPEPKSLLIQWPDAFKMNPLERAQTSAQMARSAANLARALNTIEQTNQLNAQARLPTQVPGAFNVDTGQTGPGTELPPLMTTPPTVINLLSEEECRSIIGFGKHPPIFDENGGGIEATIKHPDEP